MNDADDQGPQVGFYQYWVVLRQVLKKMSGTGRVPDTQWALVMMELENKKNNNNHGLEVSTLKRGFNDEAAG